jgi:Luciferase-like monooxygenase
MAVHRLQFGVVLANRGVVLGTTSVQALLALACQAEETGWDSVWVGDSLLAKPRLDAMVLLGALAVQTHRVKLDTEGGGKCPELSAKIAESSGHFPLDCLKLARCFRWDGELREKRNCHRVAPATPQKPGQPACSEESSHRRTPSQW